jgi:hypothetical protein
LVGAVKVPFPPLPVMLPVSNFLVALSVSVCAVESSLTTVTLAPALTVIVPLKAKFLIVIVGPEAVVALDPPEPADVDDVLLPEELDELHAVRASRAATKPAATEVRVMPNTRGPQRFGSPPTGRDLDSARLTAPPALESQRRRRPGTSDERGAGGGAR